jgi:processive 1,2-diacylglycerol beta-glucosyltransferase
MLNIHVLYEHSGDDIPHGSSTLRLLRPLSHPRLANTINMTAGTSYRGINPDIIIVDRLWKPDISIDIAEELIEYTRKEGIKLIYSLDDNILDLKINEPGTIHPTFHERNIIRYFVREADFVVVSTHNLSDRLKNLNNKIAVIENSIDERLMKNNRKYELNRKDDSIIIGYMGTYSHDLDFNEILPAIRKILFQYKGKVKLEIVGALSSNRFTGSTQNIERLDVKGNHEYTKFWSWMNDNIYWDIGIAPLKIDDFTKCKSDIKFLDYAALEIPGIFTKCPSYKDSVVDRRTGLLVDTESWVEALEELINDELLRENIGKNAKEYLLAHRTLDKCIFKWETTISKVV